MKYRETLVRTKRDVKGELDSANAELLTKASYIEQVMSGVYSYLPLGYRTLRKIEEIVREEMEGIDGQEVLLPVLQPKENWQKTGRWENLDTLYRFTSHYSKTDLVMGPTHEEIVVPLAKNYIISYKDLPKYLFQIQTKFRDEKRAKGGLLRGREFLMKDLYSFHRDEKDLDEYYEKVTKSYHNIFKRIGLSEITYLTYASGGSFSEFSHEFQTESQSGEDTIHLCEKCRVAISNDVIETQKACPLCGKNNFKTIKAIEVGNIFKLRTKFSNAFNLTFKDEDGKDKVVEMGCYGIGISRLMGTIAEVSHDEKGLIWPISVAPYQVYLISLATDKKVIETTKNLYQELTANGIEVFWDDREESAGNKFSDADLIGIPIRVVVSEKTVALDSVEIKLRTEKTPQIVARATICPKIEELIEKGK